MQGAAFGTGTEVTSTRATLSGAVAAGDLLVGWFGQYDSTGQVQVSDSVNGAWTRAPASTTFGSGTRHGDLALYYVQNTAAAAGGLTVTVSSAAATHLQGAVAEYTGVARTGALTAGAVGHGTGTTADTAPTAAVDAGALVFAGLITGGSPGSATPGNGLVIHDHTASFSVDDADALAAAGTQHAPWTLAGSTDWYDVVAAFHPAAGP